MATGTRLMQEISDQFLNCKICFENFRDPKTLSCLHTFCCACLQNQYEQEVNSRTTRYAISIYNRQVTCPLCRKKTDLPTGGVKRLPDNFLVSNLTEVLAKRTVSKVPPCEICSTVRAKKVDACSKCLDCSKILCKACVGLHLSTKVTQQHSLIDLEGEKDIQCKAHPDEYVRFYCQPCDACICVVCAFQEHRDHDVCSFNDGSAKYRGSLEALLGKCKERLSDVSTRLNAIEKYETAVKDIKENIRDLAISYISQVRAKEKELMKRVEEEYGGEIKEFVDHKQNLQENLDELQSTCNLTDIMLKDKGVELLLIKKDVEEKMTHLLLPVLPNVPSDRTSDIKFVPGDVVLGSLSFGKYDTGKEDYDAKGQIIPLQKIMLEDSSGGNTLSYTNEPDVITDTAQTEKCRTKEMSTSMRSDMWAGFSHNNSQTEAKSLITRDTSTNQVETRDRGVFAKISDMKARGTMTERSDVRSLKCQTTQSHFDETPGEFVKCQTGNNSETVSMEARLQNVTSLSSAKLGQQGAEPKVDQIVTEAMANPVEEKIGTAVDVGRSSSRGDCRPAPDLLPITAGISAFTYTPGRKIRSIKIQTEVSALDVEAAAMSTDREFVNKMVQNQLISEKLKQEQEHVSAYSRFRERPRRVRIVDAETPAVVTHIDSSTCTHSKSQLVKATSTQSIIMTDKDTCTPLLTWENKVTWTDIMSTSDRATATDATKTQDRCTGTVPLKTGDIGVQIKPYSSGISTNTPLIVTSEQESQTTVETVDQGTVPDIDIEMQNLKRDKELAKTAEVLESSVDFVTPPQSPVKPLIQTVDKATDPIKTPCFTKATETSKIKTVTSSTETPSIKYVDKDTATLSPKTIDQWTETPMPQLVSTGVTPPIPATLDVGVATNVVLTDEQATSTDIKAYRNTHTETVTVVCDNETITERTSVVDAQTGMEFWTDNQECETEKLDNTDEGSMTDFSNFWGAVNSGTQFTQSEGPSLRSIETNTTRRRRKAKETQTVFIPVPCSSCGFTISESGQCDLASGSIFASGFDHKLTMDLPGMSRKEFKDSSTVPCPLYTQDVGTMAISCVTCMHDFHETAIQTSHPKLYDKSSATSFELDLDFLERALSREYQDAATSTESLPYIGLLSEIDVDELLVVPEAAFELVSDTDSEFDLIMVDDETSTECLQTVEAGTQTLVPVEDSPGANISSMTESTGNKEVGQIIKSMIESYGSKLDNPPDSAYSKHFVSIGVNTTPKSTFEKETCTPIRHLFSKGTMTFYVAKMDKSTSTFNQARIITGSSQAKIKSEDKITMTTRAEKKHVSVETETTAIDGKITTCISKLRSVSEKLNSPPAKKAAESDTFFGTGFSSSRAGADVSDKTCSTISTTGASSIEKPEEERKRQLKTLLEQTNALLLSKDRSPVRKPQPITTLKGRKPAAVESNTLGTNLSVITRCPSPNSLKPEETAYGSQSLPRGFSSERPGTVRMGSQPLSPSRLPLLRYNSAPGRIATVPTQTLLKMSGQVTPILSPCASPRLSPSKIPISKKSSPPDYQVRNLQPQQPQMNQPTEAKLEDAVQTIPPLRRPLPSITETRTPSSCSDSSTTSYISAESTASVGPSSSKRDSTAPCVVNSRLSTDSTSPNTNVNQSSAESDKAPTSASNRLSVDSATTPSRSPSTSTSLSIASASLSDSVFRKSSTDTSHSVDSTETMEEKISADEKSTSTPPKKSGMGFMQRLLSRKKKAPETKKEPVSVLKAGPPTAAAVAALASAAPPLPAPPPESHAFAPLHLPPHHYPPLPEHTSPPAPRKPRPYVYVQQRLVSIQQDNVEEMVERKTKAEDAKEEQTDEKEKRNDKDKSSDKQKDKAKKDVQMEKERKKKKDEKEKKGKFAKTKAKKSDDKNHSPLPVKKEGGSSESTGTK